MEKYQLYNTVEALSKIIDIDSQKKKQLIEKYSNAKDIEVIKELSIIAYRVFEAKEELYDYALQVIRNINPTICPKIEEMKKALNRIHVNEIEGNMTLQDNHSLVNESLVKYTELFNQYGIDYYVVGALPCFIKTGESLFRYHDDIDIMVNEDDIEKVSKIIELSGYEFHDDRFPTIERFEEMKQNNPPHVVLAQNPNNEFHLGFFMFRREQDNSITMREYSHRLENGELIVDVLERKSDSIGTSLRYDETPTSYMGTSFKTSSIESVYDLKSYTKRPKDFTDMKKIFPYINQKKLKELKRHPNVNNELKNIKQGYEVNTHKVI